MAMKSLSRRCESVRRWLAIWAQILMGELIAATNPATDFRR